jgi:hypothetical protein
MNIHSYLKLNTSSKEGKTKTHSVYFYLNYGFKVINPVNGTAKYVPMRMATGYTFRKDQWDTSASKPNESYPFTMSFQKRIAELDMIAAVELDDYYTEHKEFPHPTVLRKLIKQKYKLY